MLWLGKAPVIREGGRGTRRCERKRLNFFEPTPFSLFISAYLQQYNVKQSRFCVDAGYFDEGDFSRILSGEQKLVDRDTVIRILFATNYTTFHCNYWLSAFNHKPLSKYLWVPDPGLKSVARICEL
jgi:hypothetical protein